MAETTSEYTDFLGGLINKNAVMGLPPRFNGLADPHNRVFLGLTTPPPIISITPGSPQPTQLDDDQKNMAQNLLRKWSEDDPESNQIIMDEVRLSIEEKSKRDARSISFDPTPKEYYKTLQVIMSRLGSRFQSATFSMPSSTDFQQFGSLMFYLNNGTSFSESGSNDYSESLMNSLYKSASAIGNEMGNVAQELGLGANAEAIASRQKAILDSANNGGDGVWAKLGMSLSGDSVLFPNKWTGSSFNRSYNLSFKFETPHGDRNSVMREVYTPFAALLAMVLPKQTSISAFTAPFLVRVDCPGSFTIDMGAITSFSFKKSMDHLTYGNYTRCIEVELTVEDLYPSLMASPDYTSLGYNFGLAYYLDNLAVVDYTNADAYAGVGERVVGAASNFALGVSGAASSNVANLKSAIKNADPIKNLFGR